MASQGSSGITRIIKAFFYSMQGFKAAFKNEQAFRQELYLAIFLVPLGIYWGESGLEKAILVSVVLLVLIVELLNSGIEAVVDRFGMEKHELSGMAKDIGSASVFAALVNVIVVWALVLLA